MKAHARVFATCAGFVVIALSFFGCGKQSGPDTSAQGAQAPAALSARKPSKPALQAELDDLGRIPIEPHPDKRPLPISQRSATARDWALNLLEEEYRQTGHTNSGWDASVLEALQAYVDYSRNYQVSRYDVITNAVTKARAAGCTDPMIEYLHTRYCIGEHNNTDEKYAIALVRACRALASTPYHPVFKLTAAYRAMAAARDCDPKGSRGALQLLANTALQDLARDTNAPSPEVFQLAFEWQNFAHAKGWTDFVMHDLEPILEANWRNDASALCLRGAAEVQRAWDARGSSWANTVSEQGWQGFRDHLETAEQLLTRSWEMCPTNAYTAYNMMRVELGQGRGRPRMEQWFHRAMAISTNYFDPVTLISFYLEPRWYGSERASLDFARSCVTNEAWGGHVPLVVPNVYHSLARYYKKEESPDYWQRPQVWADIHAAYERFFKLNPTDVGWRHDYARDAYLCGQYQAFLAQTKLFGTRTNYSFFGGQAKYEEMLRTASAGSSQ